MKVIWFANTPCGASEKLCPNLHFGGWLKSLENKLVQHEDIELTVCFYWGVRLSPFKINKTTYYPVFRETNSSKFGRLLNRILNDNNDKKEVQQLLRVIDAVQPDLIHVHGTEDNFGLIQSFTKIPVIISIQGILSPCSNKYFSGIPFWSAYWHEGIKPKLLLRSCRLQYNKLKKQAKREREILSQVHYILGRTDWDRRVTSALAPNSHYFIGNEILRSSFYKMQWNRPNFNNPIKIVTTMSGGLYKGLETIVEIAKILCNEKIIDFEWTVIGQNESDDLALIVKKWLQIDYKSHHIHLIGKKNETEVANLLLNSDIYCQVSHIENSPNSVCEAMLIGMPIIASFAGGTDSILDNRREGILVQEGEPYSFAGAIAELANNFKQANEYAKNAYEKATERHNKEQIVSELIEIYKSIQNK